MLPFSRIELDINQAGHISQAIDLACIHQLPAIVVNPLIVRDAIMRRASRCGKFKTYCMIDTQCKNKGIRKFADLPIDIFNADGYEISIGDPISDRSVEKEILEIVHFLQQKTILKDIRFTFDVYSKPKESIEKLSEIINKINSPITIRTDHSLRTKQLNTSLKAHIDTFNLIRSKTSRPIKISGNIHSLRLFGVKAYRYAADLTQFKKIKEEHQKNPQKIREVLNTK